MSRLGELYPGICVTTEQKARKNLSQGRKTLTLNKLVELYETWCSSLCSTLVRLSLYLRSDYPPQSPLLQHNLCTFHNAKD
jgi:hypothetical protein